MRYDGEPEYRPVRLQWYATGCGLFADWPFPPLWRCDLGLSHASLPHRMLFVAWRLGESMVQPFTHRHARRMPVPTSEQGVRMAARCTADVLMARPAGQGWRIHPLTCGAQRLFGRVRGRNCGCHGGQAAAGPAAAQPSHRPRRAGPPLHWRRALRPQLSFSSEHRSF